MRAADDTGRWLFNCNVSNTSAQEALHWERRSTFFTESRVERGEQGISSDQLCVTPATTAENCRTWTEDASKKDYLCMIPG